MSGLAELAQALPGALARGAFTALVVAALLLAARRWGQAAAGLLAGLPTVTGPALLWLAVDRGAPFAQEAAAGAVAAGIACALFALGYGLASRRHGPVPALLVAVAASVLPLPWLDLPNWPLGTWLLLATAVCLGCQGALRVLVQADDAAVRAAPWRSVAWGRAQAAGSGWWLTALVSGLVSALASALAGSVGPFWAGMLTSPPLLAAAVALELHRRPGRAAAALRFLHGYAAGLVGRGVFVAVFGALLAVADVGLAFVAALCLSLVTGGLSSRLLTRPALLPASMSARGQEQA